MRIAEKIGISFDANVELLKTNCTGKDAMQSEDGTPEKEKRMTLNEFYSNFFRTPDRKDPPALYIFGDQASAENWIECRNSNDAEPFYYLTMVIQTDRQMKSSLREEWVEAEIEEFYAVDKDLVCAVVKKK